MSAKFACVLEISKLFYFRVRGRMHIEKTDLLSIDELGYGRENFTGPAASADAELDEKASDRLARDLIYPAISRSGDNSNVFVVKDPGEKALRDLVRVMAEGG